jgi:hypothetical protein
MALKKYLSLLFTCIVFFSCRKEIRNTSWDTEVLAPLIKTSLTINNLLPDSLLKTQPDSSLKIVYNSELYKLKMDELFTIPDTTIKDFFVLPIDLTFSPNQIVVNNDLSETTYDFGTGVQLKSVLIKSGSVKYTVKSHIHEVTDFIYSIPSAKLNGNPFTINVSVPAAVGNTPGVYSEVFDLSGYQLNLTGINSNKINTITTSLTAKVSPLGNPVLVTTTDSLIVENTFANLIPSNAKGYFGQNTFSIGPDEIDTKIFDRIIGGSIQLENVDFNLQIENPIGLDARLYINNLSSINTKNGNIVNLVTPIINSPVNINRASESNGTVYPSYKLIHLPSDDIKPLIENIPDKFGYTIQLVTNPLGNISGSHDFIYSDKLFKATMNVEVPLSLVANDLTLVDTLNLTVSENSELNNVYDGVLTLFANNGFPFNASLQLYLLDGNNMPVDSILGNTNTIAEAPVNSSLKVTEKRTTKISIPVNADKMNLIRDTKKVLVKVKFNTSAQPNYIKIYSDYTFDVKLVGDFNYTIQVQ